MFKKLFVIAWVAVIGLTIGCKGPEGPVGPAGEKGETGATGATGPAGTSGGSGAFVLTNGADTTDANGYFYSGFSGLTAADAEVLKNAAVLVYIKAQNVYWPIPGIVIFPSNKATNFTFVHYIDGTNFLVDILGTDWSETQDTPPVRIAQDIKVIVIPAELLGRRNADINYKSYEETMAALGLTENDVKQYKSIAR